MPETWAPEIIARYVTVGTATVDLTHRLNFLTPPEPFATAAACTGCPASKEFSHWFASGDHFNGTYEEERDEELANTLARQWAQDHAETCRAMPRPTEG